MRRLDTPVGERSVVRGGLLIGLLVAAFPSLAAGPYTATDLHVPGYVASVASGTGGGKQVGVLNPTLDAVAVLWAGSAAGAINLHPAGFGSSNATGISPDGSQQVGWGFTGNAVHALLWRGSADSVIDLHPAGYNSSHANRTTGSVQVGGGSFVGAEGPRALLWRGSAASAVNLHPAGAAYSSAGDAAAEQQVGYARFGESNHAMLWSGDAASALDLHPTGFGHSIASATSGTRQVGYGVEPGGQTHALLWSGSKGSVVDLHPTGLGLTESFAADIAGDYVVGYGRGPGTGFRYHALLWTSHDPASVVDLHSFAGVSEPARSFAYAVDEHGNVAGHVDVNPSVHAFLWAVPEPAALPWAAVAAAWFGRRHARRTPPSAGVRL